MEEQIELFTTPDEEFMCDYLKLHRQSVIKLGDMIEPLGMTRKQVLKAWNKLCKQDRILKFGDIVFECLRENEQLPDYLSPASKYIRDTYYTDMAEMLGINKSIILYIYAQHYGVNSAEYAPEQFGNY